MHNAKCAIGVFCNSITHSLPIIPYAAFSD